MPGSPESNKPNHESQAPPKPQPESTANPLVPFLRDQHGQGERSHEELVASIRQHLTVYVEDMKPYEKYDPVDAMREVYLVARSRIVREYYPELRGKPSWEQPHAQLMMAWSVIAQPYYKSARTQMLGRIDLADHAEHLGHTITLDENEGKLLSAMAEAVGIPNPFGPKPPEKK
jgi:hypothetical protein